MESRVLRVERRELGLYAECGSCFGLCCVALPFAASAGFPADKAAGEPCRNLRADFRCAVHAELRERGFSGCTVYDCFGAGQKVSQHTFGGKDWRSAPETARGMFGVFPIMRHLHELLWYLTEALERPEAAPVHGELRRSLERVDGLSRGAAAQVAALDVDALRQEVGALLWRTSELVRAGVPGRRDRRGADLAGARLRGAGLRGAALRGTCLIAADLTRADLRHADLLGADLRDARLAGADLTGALFLGQAQVDGARGDGATRLPRGLTRPTHW
ncbi:pentapeptide repeat-containing protein [Streptomyces sp. WMMC897]|uniref:pentapeptide repeat-containing protein n=1 Tax=Streptomyces sp. WMMC897 TaxID=3014782 RepID=UPI0022B66500|nr:pentapeptide repeat-containing protein [Streptomyces sp. WMMC897]MCZ7416493.1 pentapeptide repeat-containing protein [Streptomyces sp. WMMC897]